MTRDPATRKAWLQTEAGRDYKARERKRYKHTDHGAATQAAHEQRHQEALQDVRMLDHTFVGVDGEGWSDSSHDSVHHYMMLICGDKHLYTGEPLTSFQSLVFLATRPVVPMQYYVSFFFDYDSTMILRDVARADPARTRELFNPNRKPGQRVWYQFGEHSIGVDYRPKKHLSVQLSGRKPVTIHDVQGFFQSSFVAALDKFDIGTPDERDYIREMKAKRDEFTPEQATDILAYSKRECVLLSHLVGQLRDHSAAAKTNAEPYEGPGSMAQRALARRYGKKRHAEVMERTPDLIATMARASYYGGRFEVVAHGPVKGTVYEYDLKSAYPYAMTQIPCFAHGHWSKRKPSPHGLIEITWDVDETGYGEAMPFPVRAKDGHIYYPSSGHGWYWAHEIPDEMIVNGIVTMHDWRYWHQQCGHRPFDWIASLYHEREYIESRQPGSGIAIKLMLNTLYGKTAQQKPVPGMFLNMLHCSFITSFTRARMYSAYRAAPEMSIVMFATDAIFSRTPLDIASDKPALGEFEHANTFDDLTIFQPGVYFDGDRAAFKTRGVPKQVFRDNAPHLRAISTDFDASFDVKLETHLGLRLALARGTPQALDQLGNWIAITKSMSPDPFKKRTRDTINHDGTLYSAPLPNMSGHTVKGHGSTYVIGPRESTAAEETRIDDDLISDGYYEGDFE